MSLIASPISYCAGISKMGKIDRFVFENPKRRKIKEIFT